MFIEAKDDGGGSDNWTTGAIEVVQTKYQQTNIQFLQAGCPSCRRTNSVRALKGNIMDDYDKILWSDSFIVREGKTCNFLKINFNSSTL